MAPLPARELKPLVEADPRLYADFYALTYENFRTAFDVISNLAMPSAKKRVADRLLLEMKTCGDGEGWIPLSQAELANLTAVQVLDRDALLQVCRG